MLDFLIAPLLVFIVLAGWLLVQFASREFARRHPEFGPPREAGGGCGGSGGCACSAGKSCKRK